MKSPQSSKKISGDDLYISQVQATIVIPDSIERKTFAFWVIFGRSSTIKLLIGERNWLHQFTQTTHEVEREEIQISGGISPEWLHASVKYHFNPTNGRTQDINVPAVRFGLQRRKQRRGNSSSASHASWCPAARKPCLQAGKQSVFYELTTWIRMSQKESKDQSCWQKCPSGCKKPGQWWALRTPH